MSKRVLIANINEEVTEVINAFKKFNIETVVVYSIKDKSKKYVELSDFSVCVSLESTNEDIINNPNMLTAAQLYNVDYIYYYNEHTELIEKLKKTCKKMNIPMIQCPMEDINSEIERLNLRISSKRKPSSKSIKCSSCNEEIDKATLEEDLSICPKCNAHLRMNSADRLKLIFDEDYTLFDENLVSEDILDFPGYSEKLISLSQQLEVKEAVITGKGCISGIETCFGIMDYRFMMGSMGTVVGEKLVRMIEEATEEKLPIVIFTASGGARMQEGMLSLYQMARVVSAIELHHKSGLLYITVLTDPTMGGVSASFASIGDIIIAEKDANIGFAGKRVIKKTTNTVLPENFQKAEFLFEKGLVDILSDRREMKDILHKILTIHERKALDSNLTEVAIDIYKNYFKRKSLLSAWDVVKLARNNKRPNFKDYIDGMITDFIELHGDRQFGDDKAIVCGIGFLNNIPVTIICNAKGKNISENVLRNFGMAKPEGYRKVQRLVKEAEKFNRPIICLIDTPGADCGIDAEERGQSEAIANCIKTYSSIKAPIISVVIGEGGSGGALATGVGDYIFMLENAIYSVISPEGCASILFKDASKAKEASEHLNLTSDKLLDIGIIDDIIFEPINGAHTAPDETVNNVKNRIYNKLLELLKESNDELVRKRYLKFRRQGSLKLDTYKLKIVNQ
ncbi:acetyl-CoA carboxylase carboxyltransferase subunit alpha [Clostridium sp. YIM B02505]|uniref:Multifunctional fusion protein n=1 Tax=Clostridium yunnanense TaxID=2800325 RepID=A0ABS1ERH0_9CLOT|nr:acetyl-CoA carboxylase carboxyltransferase subunit alpha [Clostridium yunnanense]MBK1811989.1 acetyl-CoA carboxylase carboxyltransferase subunit alpha [Clostridium yunnanense]